MNLPADLLAIRQYFWDLAQDSDRWDQASAALKSFAHEFAFGIGLPAAVAGLIVLTVLFFYQPRIPRGALWLPLFGLFGGTPKLYLHTRPPSLGGFFLKSRHRNLTLQ